MVILCFRLLYMTLVWSVAAAAPSEPLAVIEEPSQSADGGLPGTAGPHEPDAGLGATSRAAVRSGFQASWYGSQYHGRLTASGEVFDMNQLTAAHPKLPFGTRLQITCPENGRSVLVRINDRGPFVAGRDLDLSLAAARSLGIEQRGLARIEYERLAN